jgi:hypothetical protein
MYTLRTAFAINERWSLAHPSWDNDDDRPGGATPLALTVSDRQGEWDKEMSQGVYSRAAILTETAGAIR